MNVPVPPPVDLANLRALESIDGPPTLRERRRSPVRGAATPLAVLAAGAGALAWRAASLAGARRARRRAAFRLAGAGAGTTLVVGAALVLWQLPRLLAGGPRYKVELRRGTFEVRYYPEIRLAATTVRDETWTDALQVGFGRLARALFGSRGGERLGMQTPVLGTGDSDGYHIAVVIPEEAEIPPVSDPRLGTRVDIGHVPARRVAVLRFRGPSDREAIEVHKRELAHALALYGLTPRGEATFAGYDPPTTLPLLRRNELWVELATG